MCHFQSLSQFTRGYGPCMGGFSMILGLWFACKNLKNGNLPEQKGSPSGHQLFLKRRLFPNVSKDFLPIFLSAVLRYFSLQCSRYQATKHSSNDATIKRAHSEMIRSCDRGWGTSWWLLTFGGCSPNSNNLTLQWYPNLTAVWGLFIQAWHCTGTSCRISWSLHRSTVALDRHRDGSNEFHAEPMLQRDHGVTRITRMYCSFIKLKVVRCCPWKNPGTSGIRNCYIKNMVPDVSGSHVAMTKWQQPQLLLVKPMVSPMCDNPNIQQHSCIGNNIKYHLLYHIYLYVYIYIHIIDKCPISYPIMLPWCLVYINFKGSPVRTSGCKLFRRRWVLSRPQIRLEQRCSAGSSDRSWLWRNPYD